jgi:isoamylase
MKDSVIYEMHVGGFTSSESSGVSNAGTFGGVVEKIAYLKQLGVTAVELLPVMEFDETEILKKMDDGTELVNYWGYSTLSFFAPQSSYCASPELGEHLNEFRDMVKALHKAGIEVIMDVVFNHTNEGNEKGLVVNFKGFENGTYYYLVPDQKQYYMDYTGCGNTVNCNHPVVDKFIVDCLEFWIEEMHVDGFRFDEGSILSRDETGAPVRHPPLLWNIELSEAMMDTKIIAEAWDAAGLYQVGAFPGHRWSEWNGKYRDAVRRFIRGDGGVVGEVSTRIAGSADIYEHRGRKPQNSINFITCHDGFTLNDLVSYNGKRNDANGEDNRDGIDENLSWNCGVEGETDDEAVIALRDKQIKNCFTILLLSQGVPMFLMGDEVARTQGGNNNAYCQNNEVSWMDWSRCSEKADLLAFSQAIIAFRKRHSALRRDRFFEGKVNERGVADLSWHGTMLNSPGWDDPEARALAFTLGDTGGDDDLHVMMNMHWEGMDFEVPGVEGRQWHKVVDTGLVGADGCLDEEAKAPVVSDGSCPVGGRSIVVLVSKSK